MLHALLEPGDEVIVPGPEWPPTMAIVQTAQGVPVQVPLHEGLGFRWDLDEVERAITPRTKVLYLNSPNNPSGGILTRADSSASRRSRASATCGCCRTKRTRTCSSTAST